MSMNVSLSGSPSIAQSSIDLSEHLSESSSSLEEQDHFDSECQEQACMFHVQRKLHGDVDALTWGESFYAGWKSLGRKSKCAEAVQKISIVAAGILCSSFAVAAEAFAISALIEAVYNIKDEGKAPIIGHFSEWTMLGVFALSYYGELLNEISSRGRAIKIHEIFQKYFDQEDLTAEEVELLYADYLDFLQNRPATSWISIPVLPVSFETRFEFDNKLTLDRSLQNTYCDLENEMERLNFFNKFKEGWKGIQKTSFLKVILVAGGLFLGLHCLNYSLGIYWSAQQAVEDGLEGNNPSIGGHTLEWTAELLAASMLSWRVIGEIATIGKAKKITALFYKKIDSLKKEGSWQAFRKISRLFEEMKKTIQRLPQGFFFKIPNQQMYREEVKEINA